jgi:hypothetical protein
MLILSGTLHAQDISPCHVTGRMETETKQVDAATDAEFQNTSPALVQQ